MTWFAGPDELIPFLGEKNYQAVFQQLAKTECHICKRLFGEHSPEEFNAHALGDAGIEVLGVYPATPHSLLHFHGHTCPDCAKCEECSKLLQEKRGGMSQTLAVKNEIKRALAYKRLEEQRHRPYAKSSVPEEMQKLYGESRFEELSEAILSTDANKALAKLCPECHRILGEHSEEELIQCIRA